MKNKDLYIFLIILNVFDCLTTQVAVSMYGTGVEANPIMGWVIEAYSYQGMYALKALLLIPVGIFMRLFSRTFFIVLNVLFTTIVTLNLIGLIQ